MTPLTEESEADRLRRIELALWGPWGENGMAGDIKALRKALNDYVAAEERRRRESEKEDKGDQRFRFVAVLGIITAVIGPVIGFTLGQLG
jgi:hypothetical protein